MITKKVPNKLNCKLAIEEYQLNHRTTPLFKIRGFRYGTVFI